MMTQNYEASITSFEASVAAADLDTLRALQVRVKGRARLASIVAARLSEIPGTPEATLKALEEKVSEITDVPTLARLLVEVGSRPRARAIIMARLMEIPGSPEARVMDANIRMVRERNRF
jgi:hypothetical protein